MREFFSQVDLGAEPLWPLPNREYRPGVAKFTLKVLLVALGFGLLSAAGRILSERSHHIYTVCFADGALTAFLLCRPRNRWWMFLLAAWLGEAVSILVVPGHSLGSSGSLAFCNILEVLIAGLLLRRATQRNRDLASPSIMVQFLLYAVMLAPALSGLLAAVCYHFANGLGISFLFEKWFPAHALGMAVMLPFSLVLCNPNLKEIFGRKRAMRTIGILVLVPLVSGLIFQQAHYSLRFLWLPLLMLVVLEIGMLGAIMATFEVLVVGVLFTLHGHGLLQMEKGGTLQGSVLLLQSSILVLLVSIVPFAATLERQRHLRKSLRLGIGRYRLLADNSRDIVVLANLQGRRLYVSPAVVDVLGWTQEEWANQDASDYMHPEDVAAFQSMLKELVRGADRRTLRYRTRHKNGEYIWMEANLRIVHDENTGEPNAFVANVRDISERVESEQKLAEAHLHVQQQAQRDSLTQLANRRCFDEALEKEWRRGRRTNNPLALLMVDIDHFKCVNDTYGHRAGDQCLQVLAPMLRRVARRPSDLSARYGGEEFAILLPDIGLADATVLAELLCQRIREQNFEVGIGRSLALTVSIGVAALVPDKYTRADALIEAADHALYAAKQAGRNRVMPEYDDEMSTTLLHQVQ